FSLGIYEDWPDERWMDVSQEKWQQFILSLADNLIAKGFDGFFIDNTDVYYLYKKPAIYKGLTTILSSLYQKGVDIIINGGDVYVQTYINEGEPKGKIFDGVNQEDVYTSYDFDKEVYEKNDKETRTYYTEYLKKVKSRGYTVYVLEYANKASVRDEAMNYSKKNGFTCYVSEDIDLRINKG
ncbi:MAG: endo alpha-1,4 polygalactosaminidase, partial [Clostridia bacterium]|nr:endo alpha-1,4 polygalactosaminidase [Clostridia bacterium]